MIKIEKEYSRHPLQDEPGFVMFNIADYGEDREKVDAVIDDDDLLRRAFEDGVATDEERRVEERLVEKLGGFCVVKIEKR